MFAIRDQCGTAERVRNVPKSFYLLAEHSFLTGSHHLPIPVFVIAQVTNCGTSLFTFRL